MLLGKAIFVSDFAVREKEGENIKIFWCIVDFYRQLKIPSLLGDKAKRKTKEEKEESEKRYFFFKNLPLIGGIGRVP